jgi:valyl-tRNA synthetase
MGWPDDTDELKTFYPSDVLCTARDIITLWVSRMVMMGQYCAGGIPFKDVYIHAMIQDGEGRRMSKSLGNGIDPLVIILSHGADAMRFTLASMTTQTQDVRMPVEKMKLPDGRMENTSPKFDIGRNFCNKLWNASRFAIANLKGINADSFDKKKMTVTDRWILSRLAQTIAETTEALNEYKYSEPLSGLYRFFWNDFCDWYLEWIKPRMKDKNQKPIAQNILAFVLDQILRLLHPFVPFITEGIFQKLNEVAPVRKLAGLAEAQQSKALVIAQWPNRLDSLVDEDVEKRILTDQSMVRGIRDIRSEYNIPWSEKLEVSVNVSDIVVQDSDILVADLTADSDLISDLAGLEQFTPGLNIEKPENAAVSIIGDGTEAYIHDVIDIKAERHRLKKQKQRVEKAKTSIEAKLANKNFLQKAKPQVVAQAKDKLIQLSKELKIVEKHLAELENSE